MTSSAVAENQIIVRNPSSKMLKWARDNLVLDNPEYYKRLKMNKWIGNTSQEIWLYEMIGLDLRLPFGCLRSFYRTFKDECEFKAHFAVKRPVVYESGITPYDYQEHAVQNAVRAKNGIIVMPCGSGKTQVALEVISRIGGRCLWLTHTQDLLNQSMARAKSVLTTKARYGRITAGKVDIGDGITFATVQTMSKLDLASYKNTFDIIVVDECQHCCGSPTRVTQFYKVVNSLSARYKYGLTATPKRADGLERSIFALLGDIICVVSKEDVANTTCPVKIRSVETGYTPNYDAVLMGDGTIDYSRLVENLTNDPERFSFVSDVIQSLDGPCIVLANRVEYLEKLRANAAMSGLKVMCLSTIGNSKSAKALRKNALADLNNGDLDVIFATYQLAKEGLDVPNLRYVVFATPEKDETTIVQAVGRVGRKAEGKDFGTVIDFVDDFGMYKGWAKKRKGYYKKIGADIE